MKIIKGTANMITEQNPLKRIELIGRICYKSEDKICEGSADKFVSNLIKRNHFAMLEHSRITFEVSGLVSLPGTILNLPAVGYTTKGYIDGEPINYLTLSCSHIFQYQYTDELPESLDGILFRMCYVAFATKYLGAKTRTEQEPGVVEAVVDNNIKLRVKVIESPKDEIINYDWTDHLVHDYYSFHFICDRGVSHELVRHRAALAQESTRYCNYASAKFGGEMTFIEPSTFEEWPEGARYLFKSVCSQSEVAYLELINQFNRTPQQARAVLPNALKTEVVITMPVWQCSHFFNLRSLGTTGAPHPDMKYVADQAYELWQSAEAPYLERFDMLDSDQPDYQTEEAESTQPNACAVTLGTDNMVEPVESTIEQSTDAHVEDYTEPKE